MKYRLTIDRQDGPREVHEYPDKAWLYGDLDEDFHGLQEGDTYEVEILVRQAEMFGEDDG